MPYKLDLPILLKPSSADFTNFVKSVNRSGHKWVLLTNEDNKPVLMLDAYGFVRAIITDNISDDPYAFCHRPLIIEDVTCTLGSAMLSLKVAQNKEQSSDDVLHADVILVWSDTSPRLITGADILGCLLKGIGLKEREQQYPLKPIDTVNV